MCEFAEHMLWYVPKKARGKLNARWRHGIFLGRSLSSDQNYIGLSSGDVTTARAMVRLVPSLRWDLERASKVKMTPTTLKMANIDILESEDLPKKSDEPNLEESEEEKAKKRLKITTADIVRHGYTPKCYKCKNPGGRKTHTRCATPSQ